MRAVAVVGVGMTRFGKFPELGLEMLGRQAVLEALTDARQEPDSIQAAYCGNAVGGNGVGQRVLHEIGMGGIPIVNIENACASGSTAFREAWLSVAAGMYDVVLTLGVESLTSQFKGLISLDREHDLGASLGLTMPATYALIAQRHIALYGTTPEQLALVSVKNHRNGLHNPHSQYQVEFTVQEVLASRMIASPLTLYQCCPSSDGAAAVILCSIKKTRRFGRTPIRVLSSSLTSGLPLHGGQELAHSDITRRAAQAAYEQAGLAPKDIHLAEVHDAFTIGEIVACESLGFCAAGEGGPLVESGETGIAGRIPVNPSGGLLSKGHPVGATGVAQIAEIVWQLRGEAGARQVDEAKVGLTHTLGGGISALDGNACCVTILGR